ncbi:diacylglycerol/lipid kinase family protein [Thermospira aquatica]|uniref:Diacylglycerol kinase family lipid kinase n=1 Tax=Thermospira aquatica TaxID=2828656 RepID=A0AAX3BEV4_9SPIR|nr:diacylglycerol kinase family protein [Thermospira aquatica]URA10800.1 diacylglycerol kinase family lipid kinase [Thermospira aquatica]
MRYFFVANTLHKRHEKALLRCVAWLRERGHEVEIAYTQYPGHAQELASKAALSGWECLVGAGGDGTLHEVLNGIMGTNALLALYPMGTGNVFAREMRLPVFWHSIAMMLHEAHTLTLDVGKAGDRYFLLMLSAGFDAYAIRTLSRMEGDYRQRGLRTIFGKFAYVVGGLQALGRYAFPLIDVEIDGKKTQASFVLVSNIQRYGRYFKITPKASPVDGMLDVFLYTEVGRWNLLRLVWQVLSSLWKPYGGETLFYKQSGIRCTTLALKSKEEVFSQLDGELFRPLPLEISVYPRAIRMILPRGIHKKYQSW